MNIKDIFEEDNIVLGLPSTSKEEAIADAGRLLERRGYVGPNYIASMFEREEIVSTYIGHGVAIPHGIPALRKSNSSSGIVLLQYPKGIEYEGNTCYLVIGISGNKSDHLAILQHIAKVLQNEETAKMLWTTADKLLVYNTFVKEVNV